MKFYLILYIIISPFLILSNESIDTVPMVQNFGKVKTHWNDFKQASPSENIPSIEIPNPDAMGNNNCSFQLTLPEARRGFQPDLMVNYNIEGGVTWLGTGWDLSVSSFGLDTRWGVPTYDESIESEIYLYDGKQLGPVFHRQAEYLRETDREFFLRQEGKFDKIIRHGNSPTNYWWEVLSKNGVVRYYGGNPIQGVSNDCVLRTSEGQITEWLLKEERDVYNNLIKYKYRERTFGMGKSKLLSEITYNGKGEVEGNYKIQFELRDDAPRKDGVVNCRTGMVYSMFDLLREIRISYKEENIRSYRFEYITGAFSKTLLKSITELDQNDEVFYNYDFEYFNDLNFGDNRVEFFSDGTDWSVSKDKVEVNTITATSVVDFLQEPTILGGATSENTSLGFAFTVGIPGSPATKENTVGGNGGAIQSKGNGVTGLVDIDGDGLPDKLWKEDGILYYRKNRIKEGVRGFDINATKINGISDFSVSETTGWNAGGELNLGFGNIGGFIGYSHEENFTKISTYLGDFNGDELMDIVHNRDVYFNHLENGVPNFDKNVNLTESPIFLGEPIDPSLITVDPNAQREEENRNPLHDVVREWTVPESGVISILGDCRLLDLSDCDSEETRNKDGVIVMIQLGNLELWRDRIEGDDYNSRTPQNVTAFPVIRGQKLYFRVHSVYNGFCDQVEWNPVIQYVDKDLNQIDANCIPHYEYNSQNDFLLSEKQSFILPDSGQVRINGMLNKPLLTDSIVIQFLGGIQLDTVLYADEVIDGNFVIEGINVLGSEEFSVQVIANSNVDWTSIEWNPVVEYTAFENGRDAFDSNGDPILTICPLVFYRTYNEVERFGEHFIAQSDGLLRISTTITGANLSTNPSYLSIKRKSQKDTFLHSEVKLIIADTLIVNEIPVLVGDTIFADLFNLGNESSFKDLTVADCQFNLNGQQSAFNCGVYNRSLSGSERESYRNWSQFVYNGNDGRGGLPINLSDLDIDTTGLANDTLLIDDNTDPDGVQGANADTDNLFIVMRADSKSLAWQGLDPLTFYRNSIFSSSRNGNQDVDLSTEPPVGSTNIKSINLGTQFVSDAIAAGASAISVSGGGGVTSATSWSIQDVTDMNGDRFPDHVRENSIQYTQMRGGLSSITFNHNWGTHEAGSLAGGGGVGGSYVSSSAKTSSAALGRGSNKLGNRTRSRNKSRMNSALNAFKKSKSSIGVSGNLTSDSDWTNHSFLDINGDGLEDKVWSNGEVRLNLGYDFTPVFNWGFPDIRSGDALDFGGGVGLNIMNGSIMGGLSISRTNNQMETGFVDLNDDALLDYIVSVDPLVVRFNNGSGLDDEVELNIDSDIDEGVSIGESLNGGITICVNFVFFRVCFNPTGSKGQGTSSVTSSFADIDGDGYVDFLTAQKDDGNLNVRSSKVSKTNMLKKIDTPLGGEITFDYSPNGNTQTMPFSKWVYSSVEVNDGVQGDGVDIMKKEFGYSDGYYDRHERQFYGFGTVTEKHFFNNGSVGRELVTEYNNKDYYSKGLIKSQSLKNGRDELFQVTDYSYSLRDVENGLVLPPNYVERDDGMAFPALDKKSFKIYEKSNSDFVTRDMIFEYDSIGNILVEYDNDELGSRMRTEYSYEYYDDKYLANIVSNEMIFGNDILFRQTDYELDERGNQLKIIESINESNFAVTDMEYDEYGNLIRIQNPMNSDGERLEYRYEYDETENQYAIYDWVNYGYENFYNYEYLHNQLIEHVDINGNKTNYTIDAKGRPLELILPYENESGEDYSVKYSYNLEVHPSYALAEHTDVQNDTDLMFYTFEDGIHREIQTKVSASIYNGSSSEAKLIVSGTEMYDALGRVVETYLPVTENLNSGPTYNASTDVVTPTRITYDVLDRPIKVIDTYNAETTFTHILETEGNYTKYLKTVETNARGNEVHSYFNGRGDIVAERFGKIEDNILWQYYYDGYNQVNQILDPFENETVYEYDMLGRRVSVKVPDAGTTFLKYDNANNLTERITATIRDVVSNDGAIKYKYDKERLIQIDYPKYFQNKVQLHYGTAQDSFNRAGRIWLQEDASGGQEFFFDPNGNPNKVIRTMMINRSDIYTYVSEFEYDTWGRVLNMDYPDGESVIYKYNIGGQVESITSVKGETEMDIVKFAGYDKFIDRIYTHYGNDVTDERGFDDKGRFFKHGVKNRSNQMMVNETFSYDLVDNVISRVNIANAPEVGGLNQETFEYDLLNRLISANGNISLETEESGYEAFFDYDAINNILMKGQTHIINNNQQILTTRVLDYEYEHLDQPTRPSIIGGKDVSYDANGNLLLLTSTSQFDFDQNVYDEENRLIGSSNNGYISRYTYDAFGHRAIKSHGENQGVFINGAPAGFLEHDVNYIAYISPYFSITKNAFRKHYFIDEERILTKIGTGVFQTTLGSGPDLTAGSIDFKSRITQFENSILDYYESLDIPPGHPTLLGYLGQPEINLNSLPEAQADSLYFIPPPNWPLLNEPDTMGPPGHPVFYDIQNQTNEDVSAGYNFERGTVAREVEQFYYHYDQNGNTHLVTDYQGGSRQSALYFPSGELWFSQSNGIDSTSYYYNGLELDDETGYYNIGDVYYDPVVNVELSVDPVLQNFGEETFKTRIEGDYYYDYSDEEIDDEVAFDNEILNSERPETFLLDAINGIEPLNDQITKAPEILLTYGDVIDAFGGQEPGWNPTANDVDENSRFFSEIKDLAPHLADRDFSNPKEFKKLVKKVLVTDKRAQAKRILRKILKLKEKKETPKVNKVKRKVRFK